MSDAAWSGQAEGSSTSIGARLAPLALPLAVVSLTSVVWWAVRAGPYRLDDFATPLDDPASASLRAFIDHLPRTLRPLTKLTYAFEASLGVTEAALRRGVTATLHAVGAGALFVFLWRVGSPRWLAALLALVWALHPVHAESVLSVAGRSATMGATSVLLALALLSLGHARAAAVAMALAVLGREAAVGGVLAVAALALLGARGPGTRLERVGPILIGVLGALTWAVLRPRARVLAEYSFLGRPLWTSIVQQISAVPVGLSLYVRPWALSCDHGEALPTSAGSLLFVSGVLLLAAAGFAAFLLRRRAPTVCVGLCLWLGALLPTQTLFPKLDPLTERPLGLALAGLLVMLAPALAGLARQSRAARFAVIAACASAVLITLQLTLARGALYASDVALWSDAATKSVANPRPFVELALALDADGRRPEAIAALRRARDIDPFKSSVQARLRLWEQAEMQQENSR